MKWTSVYQVRYSYGMGDNCTQGQTDNNGNLSDGYKKRKRKQGRRVFFFNRECCGTLEMDLVFSYTKDGYTPPTRVCVIYENERQMYAGNGQTIMKTHKKNIYFSPTDVVFDKKRSTVANQGSSLGQLHTRVAHAQLKQQVFA